MNQECSGSTGQKQCTSVATVRFAFLGPLLNGSTVDSRRSNVRLSPCLALRGRTFYLPSTLAPILRMASMDFCFNWASRSGTQ